MTRLCHFYPRSPCGERPTWDGSRRHRPNFYPRSPCGERPKTDGKIQWKDCISIHALLAESDLFILSLPRTRQHFYPRSPCGERRNIGYIFIGENIFLSTLSLRRATGPSRTSPCVVIFLSTLCTRCAAAFLNNFYPRSPCGERPVLWRSCPRS